MATALFTVPASNGASILPSAASCPQALSFSRSSLLGRRATFPRRRIALKPQMEFSVLATAASTADEEEVAATLEEASVPATTVSSPFRKQKSKAPPQQVSLRFVWMEKNIGIALDHMVAGHGTVPLSPFYFWPRKDAWEEIKTKLESKSWISRKQTILLLNQATDIINLWQNSASGM